MNWQEHITVDPAVLVGKPVLTGTRLAVEFVLGLIAQGWNEQEIARHYHLTTDQIRAAVAYAQERLADERGFLVAAWRGSPALCQRERLRRVRASPALRRPRCSVDP